MKSLTEWTQGLSPVPDRSFGPCSSELERLENRYLSGSHRRLTACVSPTRMTTFIQYGFPLLRG